MPARPCLTPSQKDELAKMYQGGARYAEVAAAFNCSDYAVRLTLRERGVERREPGSDRAALRGPRLAAAIELYRGGASVMSVAREFDVGIEAARGAMQRAGVLRGDRRPHAWTAEELEDVERRYAAGEAVLPIADSFKCSKETIARLLRSKGIEIRKGKLVQPPRPRLVMGQYIAVYIDPTDPMACMAQASGYVLEHRLVVARRLGRPLLPTETVHHVDGVSHNNKLENLQLRQGRHGVGYAVRCADCGSDRIKPVPLASPPRRPDLPAAV